MKYNLSEITDLIKDRRTIYPEQFSSRKVHREIIENILRSATWAPTHGKTEPWRFSVFMGEATAELARAQQAFYREHTADEHFLQRKFERYASRAARSSVIIGVGMQRQETRKIAEIDEVLAVGCAVQNLSLHAAAYGLGTFWSTGGFAFSDAAKALLGLNDPDDRGLGFLYVGYPEGDWPKSHRKPLEYVTRWIGE